ncbi:MAG: cyclase family protein [Planctomycetota bacterium]
MIYDISPAITPSLAVFPGDTPPSRETLLDMHRGDHLTLSTLHMTAHLGAHVDGPNHYGRDARAIHEQPLNLYIGPCQVMHVPMERSTRIRPEDLPDPITASRLLLATGTYPDPYQWNEDFAGLDPTLVEHLREQHVRLIGIDTPSVDLSTAKDLAAHHACLEHDVSILEGIVLHHVPAGEYELIALPLPLVGCDASPVRAILRTTD